MGQKFKNWLIKRLGGYTQEEYHRIEYKPLPVLRVEEHRPIKLRSTMTINNAYLGGIERATRVVEQRLADDIRQHIAWEKWDGYCPDEVVITGTITVLEQEDKR